MAELLIKTRNYTNPDGEADRTASYKKGYIIAVRENGYQWARYESKQQWLAEGLSADDWHNQTAILKVPDITAAKAIELTSDQVEDDNGAPLTDSDGAPVRFRRRRWQLLVDNIPAGKKAEIRDNGETSATKTQIKNFLKRIRDNAQYTGLD